MLEINRIKAISRTESGTYGFDYSLSEGLNLISSNINTRGKSSVLLAIYYCLGLEEIIGGRGKKTLTSVYKTAVEDENHISHRVLESEAWIEITNGLDIISVKRTAEMEGRNENLITVYHSNMESVYKPETYVEDMYVHSANATTSTIGFHAFLEKFIGFNLPRVPSNDGAEYKLYMQLIFSGIFIEQKRGWADIFSAMPVLNIKDAKKRVLEYILGLDTLANEKKRASLKISESTIAHKWDELAKEIVILCNREDCRVLGLPLKPCILDDDSTISILTINGNVPIAEKISALEQRWGQLNRKTPKIVDNFEELQNELEQTESSIHNLEDEQHRNLQTMLYEKAALKKLETNLEIINQDLQNNKDAQKLRKMGSELEIESYNGRCPVCGQVIQDSLLPVQNCEHTMSIEENIRHLESQKSMVTFAINAHRQNIETCETNQRAISGRIFTLRRLAKTIRSDLFSIDESLSETVVYERINVENRIQSLRKLNAEVQERIDSLIRLSDEWSYYLAEKKSLPRSNFTQRDKEKVEALESNFKRYLQAFNYQSVSSYDSIQISHDNYLPISEGFDMKFDSSASDNIRAIWAYTLALLRTSNETGGNHPQIVLFDEPGQHSIVTEDMVSLFREIIELPGKNQLIVGITLNDGEICKAVDEIEKDRVHIIDVGNHAFTVI